jgi:hypothetical protein
LSFPLPAVRNLDELFAALNRSSFRSRFKLSARERAYLRQRGVPQILQHAAEFIATRLAPADPQNDGKQTPMRNHPVFVAQHATATCCRGCLAKWHGIPKGRELTVQERQYAVGVIERWLRNQGVEDGAAGSLFDAS